MRTLLALALFLGLVAQAYSLRCYACDSSRERCDLVQRIVTCNDTLNLTCVTFTIRMKLPLPTSGFLEIQQTLSGCGFCTDLISFNSGQTSISVHSACCNSNLCNSQVEPEKENMTLNGLQCEGCLTLTETACNQSMATVSCHGEQNHCIHAMGIMGNTSHIIKGCASESLCNDGTINSLFQLRDGNITCCQENWCNNGSQNNTITTSSPITQARTSPLPITPLPTTPARTTVTGKDNNTASAIYTQPLLITLLLVLWATVH